MASEREKFEAALAAVEAQRGLLGDDVVDASISALRARIVALSPPPAPSPALRQVSILFLDVVGSTWLGQYLDPEEIGAVMDGALTRATRVVDAHGGRVLQYAGDNLLAVFGADEAREDDAERAVRCGLELLVLGARLGAEVEAAHGHAGSNVRAGVHTGRVLLGAGVDDADSIRGIAVNIAARLEQTAPSGALRISQDTYSQVRGVFDVAPQEPLSVKGVDAPITTYLVLRAKPRAFRVEARGIEGVATRMIGRDVELGQLQAAFERLVEPGAPLERVLVVAEAGVDDADSIRGIAVNIAARLEQTAPSGALRISQDTYSQVRGVFDVAPQEPLSVKGVDAPITTYLVLRAKPRAFRVEARGIEGVATRMIGRDAELGRLQAAFERLVEPDAQLERVLVVAEAGVGKSRLLDEFRSWSEARPERYFVFQARATPQTQGEPYGLLRDLLTWRLQIADADTMAVAKRKLEEGLMPLLDADEGEREAEAHVHLLGQLIGLDYADSPHVRNIRDDGRQIRGRAFHAAARALRRIRATNGSPVMVYLDDLHWADDGSLDFFEYLAQANRDVPTLIVGLARPTLFERRPDAFGALRRIDLHPLDRASSRGLADELLKRLAEIPAALRELIIGGADGNPFYMEELVKMLIDRGAIDASGEPWTVDGGRLLSLQVPPTLTGVLQARLDGLPSPERHALQLASVIGLNFWDAALAHVQPSAVAELRPLAHRKLVSVRDADHADAVREYVFQHQLLHQVTYDTVLKTVRRDAHARTADWLAEHSGARAKGLLGTAAEHFEKAGDRARAAEFYTRAAAYMAETFANDATLHYTARALTLADAQADDLRWRLVTTRERTLDLLGRRTEQLQDIESLLALAETLDDDGKRGEAAWRRCDIALRVGDYATQEREARRALQLAERAGDDELVFRAIHRLSVAVARLGDPGAGRAMAEEGLVRARRLGHSEFRMANAATVCVELQGDLVAFLHYAALSVSFARASEDRRAEAIELGNLGMAHALLGDFDASRRHLDDASRLNRNVGNRLSEGNNLIALSEISWLMNESDVALLQAEQAVAIQTEVGSRLHLSNAFRVLANAQLALGRIDEATAAFERSEALGREIGQSSLVLNAIEGLTRVALARGDDGEARRAAARLLSAAGLDPSTSAGRPTDVQPQPFAGAEEHLIRATLYRVWSRARDPRAGDALIEAHRALLAAADTISDAALKDSFLRRFPAHREIVDAWTSTSVRSSRDPRSMR